MDVSICVPVYNEREALRPTILELIEAFDKLPYKYEIIVIDDASSDGSLETIRDLPVRVIRHKRNLVAESRVTGMRYARAPIIFQTDADYTYPCDKVSEIIERMKDADMVVAARTSESARDWWIFRVFVKWLLKSIASFLIGKNIPDLNSGMRAYKRSLGLRYAYLYPRGHSIMSTITLAFLAEGFRVDFVEIDYRRRIGQSTFRPLQDTYNYMVTIIRTIVNFDPLRILLPVILFVVFIAALWTGRDIYIAQRVSGVSVILWITSLLISMLAILSDQFSRLSRQLARIGEKHWESLDGDIIREIMAGDEERNS